MIGLVCLLQIWRPQVFERLERMTYDWRAREGTAHSPLIATNLGFVFIDDASIEAFKDAVWGLTGLIRVYLRRDRQVADEPVALVRGATVADVAASVHRGLRARLQGARIWGTAARFDGQHVGRDQPVHDGDVVEILYRS